ncbi:MAG: CRISPR-associated endonuclease Cas1 [Gaiella sp.]
MREQATRTPDQRAKRATNPARLREQHRDHGTLPAQLRRKGDVLVVDGHGVTLAVDRGRLVARDGAGQHRQERSFGKVTHGLGRVVVLGGTGTVSLAALRWLRDQGVPLITLDEDGQPLCTSSATVEDARLYRQQALAPHTPAGLTVARYLLGEKLRGQLALASQLTGSNDIVATIADELERLEHATEIDELLSCEREAALAYWSGWAPIPVRFGPGGIERVPEHWQQFTQRHSPLTSAPRAAVNPANAILNYLYALLEAEARIACHTVGLSPTLGIVHVDYRHRDSFCLDLIEAVRPEVDRYLLALLRGRVFRTDDFYETRRGGCRILAPLTHTLAATTVEWAQLLAPVCEHVAAHLADTPGSRITGLPTPLSGHNHHEAREPRRRRARPGVPRSAARAPRTCARCGGDLPHQKRVYCPPCEALFRQEQKAQAGSPTPIEGARARKGTDTSHGAEAAERRAATNIARKRAVREWDQEYGKLIDLSVFERDVLPLIQNVPLSRLQRATGLSLRYVSQIRRGEKTPHPRHWAAIETTTAAVPAD